MTIDSIDSEIQIFKTELPKINVQSPDYLFTLVCAKYFFHEGHYSFKDYKTSFVDGKNDGGIDLIEVDDSEPEPVLIFCQGKNHQFLANKQDVVDVFTKIHQTITNFKSGKTANYNSTLRRVFTEKYEFVKDSSPKIRLVLFLATEIDDERKRNIATFVESVTELSDYECLLYDGRDIISQIEDIKNPHSYVLEDSIKFCREDHWLRYEEDGLMVNIYASSLRRLYNKHRDSGLFAQNFRYFVKNKKIDDSVIKTLHKRREDFWYLNNGLIIGCQNWIIDGDKISLENFSIVNGCQTTTLIGEYNGGNEADDFKIPCKIIKSESKRETFISEVAEASNSQKPILDRDLKSNYPEQVQLRRQLAAFDPAIYLEIKRGQDQPNKRGKEPWRFIKNDVLGQYYLSFIYQQPGTARSNKSKIFSDTDTYNKLFKRTHDSAMVADILKLALYYSDYQEEKVKSGALSIDEESVLLSSDKVVLALIGFLVKMKRKLIDMRALHDPEQWATEVSRDDVVGTFLNFEHPDFDKKLSGLFSRLNVHLCNSYGTHKAEEKNISNFLKTDPKYREKILRYVVKIELDDTYARDLFEESFMGLFK